MSDVFDLLTKFPVLIGIIIGTFSTVIGSILALITTIITNRSQRHREREQWTREKVQEIYSNSIASLTILSANHSLLSLLSKEFANALKWLNILLIYQPQKYKEEFVTLPEEVNLFSS
jgi:ABC-type multidrug transport system fused ATPase/permease subunit